eukprot:8816181-Karenia_brevis.AAC.1
MVELPPVQVALCVRLGNQRHCGEVRQIVKAMQKHPHVLPMQDPDSDPQSEQGVPQLSMQ